MYCGNYQSRNTMNLPLYKELESIQLFPNYTNGECIQVNDLVTCLTTKVISVFSATCTCVYIQYMHDDP